MSEQPLVNKYTSTLAAEPSARECYAAIEQSVAEHQVVSASPEPLVTKAPTIGHSEEKLRAVLRHGGADE